MSIVISRNLFVSRLTSRRAAWIAIGIAVLTVTDLLGVFDRPACDCREIEC